MAAASLDVNFKEELSAIEQCMSMLSIVSHAHTDMALVAQGSEFSQKQSAPLHCTVSYSTPLMSKSVSLSPSCSKWPVRIP